MMLDNTSTECWSPCATLMQALHTAIETAKAPLSPPAAPAVLHPPVSQ